MLVTAGDGSIESSENSAMSAVSWVSELGAVVRLGRVGNSSMVRSMVGCGVVSVVVSVVVGICSGGVSATAVPESSSTLMAKLGASSWSVVAV